MEVSFNYSAERDYYAIRFNPGEFESAPFIRELRFWGVDRVPCKQLGTLAALIALTRHPVKTLTLADAEISPPVSTALANHFQVEIRSERYDNNRRSLAGGDKVIAPVRFGDMEWSGLIGDAGTEVLAWISLDDLDGPFGGQVRTNVDAFDMTEAEKNLIVALCCGGMDVGHIVVDGVSPVIAQVLHRIGLELIVR